MSTFNQYQSDLAEEQLWNNEYLFPCTKNWNTAVVLCFFKPVEFDFAKKMAGVFANKVDHMFGTLKKGKAQRIEQRIEKLQMLEYGEDKRGWHCNTFLNRPDRIDHDEFIECMEDLWLGTILKPWQVEFAKENSDLFWGEPAKNGYYKYCVKKRAEQAAIPRNETVIGLSKTPNDLLIDKTLTIHESNINSKPCT